MGEESWDKGCDSLHRKSGRQHRLWRAETCFVGRNSNNYISINELWRR
jgi:hypothetical protein